MKTSLILRLMALPLAMAVGSCGDDEGANRFVKAGMTPETPTIYFTDATFGSGDNAVDVPAPWHIASFIIVNENPDDELIIPAVKVEYTFRKNGVTGTGTATPDWESVCDLSGGDDRETYAIVQPNSTFKGNFDCDNDYSESGDEEFYYMNGLPTDDDDDPSIRNYSIKVTFEGFYRSTTDSTDFKDRVEIVRYYTSQ